MSDKVDHARATRCIDSIRVGHGVITSEGMNHLADCYEDLSRRLDEALAVPTTDEYQPVAWLSIKHIDGPAILNAFIASRAERLGVK